MLSFRMAMCRGFSERKGKSTFTPSLFSPKRSFKPCKSHSFTFWQSSLVIVYKFLAVLLLLLVVVVVVVEEAEEVGTGGASKAVGPGVGSAGLDGLRLPLDWRFTKLSHWLKLVFPRLLILLSSFSSLVDAVDEGVFAFFRRRRRISGVFSAESGRPSSAAPSLGIDDEEGCSGSWDNVFTSPDWELQVWLNVRLSKSLLRIGQSTVHYASVRRAPSDVQLEHFLFTQNFMTPGSSKEENVCKIISNTQRTHLF